MIVVLQTTRQGFPEALRSRRVEQEEGSSRKRRARALEWAATCWRAWQRLVASLAQLSYSWSQSRSSKIPEKREGRTLRRFLCLDTLLRLQFRPGLLILILVLDERHALDLAQTLPELPLDPLPLALAAPQLALDPSERLPQRSPLLQRAEDGGGTVLPREPGERRRRREQGGEERVERGEELVAVRLARRGGSVSLGQTLQSQRGPALRLTDARKSCKSCFRSASSPPCRFHCSASCFGVSSRATEGPASAMAARRVLQS